MVTPRCRTPLLDRGAAVLSPRTTAQQFASATFLPPGASQAQRGHHSPLRAPPRTKPPPVNPPAAGSHPSSAFRNFSPRQPLSFAPKFRFQELQPLPGALATPQVPLSGTSALASLSGCLRSSSFRTSTRTRRGVSAVSRTGHAGSMPLASTTPPGGDNPNPTDLAKSHPGPHSRSPPQATSLSRLRPLAGEGWGYRSSRSTAQLTAGLDVDEIDIAPCAKPLTLPGRRASIRSIRLPRAL